MVMVRQFDELANNSINLTRNQKEIDRLKNAIKKSFLEIDYKMRELPEMKLLKQKIEENPQLSAVNLKKFDAGSTALLCLITPTHLIVANCGDSRAILVSDDKISFATKDHTAHDPKEKYRIERAGGEIDNDFYISDLKASRALGDYLLKQDQQKEPSNQMISSKPDIYVRERTEKDEYLVLANRGVWDWFSNEELKEQIKKLNGNSYYSSLDTLTKEIIAFCEESVRLLF